MKKYTQEELNEILKNHQHWLNEDCRHWQSMRADLSDTDLSDADLSDANLNNANLHRANLYHANLCCANLRYADLIGANLSDANLYRANLYYADLSGANLYRANLSYADLHHASLCSANLRYADLKDAQNIPFIPFACPDTGSFIGYKKAGNYIVELKILSDARRCSATGRKCRCDRAEVLSIQYIDKTPCDDMKVASDYNKNFIYRVGEIVEEPNFDENRWKECAKGIHFFINRQEAVEF